MKPDTTTRPRGAILAVTSGKGGVGKTNVVINLAVSLARLGHRVGILDADFGLGNIDVMIGLTPTLHLGHVLSGERQLEEIMLEGPLGVQIVPAGTGIRAMTALTASQWTRLGAVIKRLAMGLDFLLIDTAAGISDNVVELLMMAERVLVVTSFEPTAVVDAYAMVKILTAASPNKDVGIVVNAARDSDESGLVFRQLDIASSRFLHRGLRYYGFVVQDPAVREAVLVQRPIVDHLPQSPASRCFRILASRIAGLAPTGPGLRLAHAGDAPTDDTPDGGDSIIEPVERPRCA
jgi:flagellar biosynthesis protein FlhG